MPVFNQSTNAFTKMNMINVKTTSEDGYVNITELGHYQDGKGRTFYVEVSGAYAYVCDNDDGLEIIDVSDPTNPVEVGQFLDGGQAKEVFIRGDYAYLADGEDGLEIIDISDPTSPTKVGGYSSEMIYFQDIFVSGYNVYVSVGHNGLKIINVHDPTNPTLIGEYEHTASHVSGQIFVSGSYLYNAILEDGLTIFELSFDSDGDGLTDEEELELGDDGYITDPNNPDSNGDGLSDGDEYDYSTNPNDEDSDDDGFTDSEEIAAGTDPNDPEDYPSSTTEDGSSFTFLLVVSVISLVSIAVLIKFKRKSTN